MQSLKNLLWSLVVQTISISIYVYSNSFCLALVAVIILLILIKSSSTGIFSNGIFWTWLFWNLLVTISLHSGALLNANAALLLGSILLIIFLPTLLAQVPFFPTTSSHYSAINNQIVGDRFIDLGCGFGSLLTYLAKKNPAMQFVGIELAPLPFLISWLRALGHNNLKIKYQSIWSEDLSFYSTIYAFLSPAVSEKLLDKLRSSSTKGQRYIINSFPLATEPQQIIADKIYIYGNLNE